MSASTTAVISTRELTRRFGDKVAVDALTLDIYEGEVFGFLGHNGAGKTTTVRLINGVLTPTSGQVRVFGLDPGTDGAKIRARTGVLTETPALDDRLTARATLTFYADVFGVPKDQVRKRVDTLLETFDLADRADDKVGGFSKGMRQRVALARTMLHEPQVVFLDEPTSGLDPAATREVHQMIERLRSSGRTVFLATHNLTEAERLCDRVAVLAHGRALAVGSVSQLAERLNRGHRLLVEVNKAQVQRAAQVVGSIPHVSGVEPTNEHNGNGYAHGNGNGAGNGGGHGAGQGDGASVLRVLGSAREDVPQVIAALVAAGIDLYRVEPDEASLEDVYFALEHE